MNEQPASEYCTKCGRSLRAEQWFCPRCGMARAGGDVRSPPPSPAPENEMTVVRGSLHDLLDVQGPSAAGRPPHVASQQITPSAGHGIPMPGDVSPAVPAPMRGNVPSYGQRAGAYLIDVLPPIVLAWIVYLVVGPKFGSTDVYGYNSGPGIGFVLGYWLLVSITIGTYCVYYNGRGGTVGKRLIGLRVVDVETGEPIGTGRAFVRYLVWILPNSCCIPLSALSPFFDSSKRLRGWHDMAARSIVVHAEKLPFREAIKPYVL